MVSVDGYVNMIMNLDKIRRYLCNSVCMYVFNILERCVFMNDLLEYSCTCK